MKAIVIHAYGGPDVLKFEDVPDPVPGNGEVLVKTAATSVNPIDYKIRAGAIKSYVTLPAVLGRDVSGIVAALGVGVTKFKVGDKVFAAVSRTYAALCVVKETDLARIPNGLDIEQAAALPTVTLTGAQLATLALSQSPKGSVLVAGAAGSVGRSAVFTAKEKGATVYAGVRASQKAEAARIGADFVVALDDEEAVRNLKPLDAVADAVNGKTAQLLIGKVKPGGVFASVVGQPANAAAHPEVAAKAMQVHPDVEMLVHMAEAVRDGKLAIPIRGKFPLSEAGKAQAAAEQGGGGKILLLA
jgi:NADPH:quinone reductase-like Zn-dependent oxidoreductase